MELTLEIFQFLTDTCILTKHEQNLRRPNIKLLDFVSFLQKVTLNSPPLPCDLYQRILLYYYTGTKEMVYESLNLNQGVVYK